jgi:hypothetical protein
MKKILLLIFSATILVSCGDSVTLNKDFVVVDNVQQNSDGTFEISLRNGPSSDGTKSNTNIHFTSKFRLQAGDTMWSRYQLKEYNVNKFTNLSIENNALKDTVGMLRKSLQNAELENQLLKNYYYSSVNKK